MATQDIGAPSLPDTKTSTPTERNKYKSPPPPPSSMTPPPSSQAPTHSVSKARTPSPAPAHLSSPPPTIKSQHTTQPPSHDNGDYHVGMYSTEQIANASAEDLRNMLTETLAAYREARTSAAHHNLQYTLLSMESSEAMKRMEVELEMKQKEVDVLQQQGRKNSSAMATPVMSNQGVPRSSSPNDRIVLDLRNACRLLEIENENLRRRLTDAKAALIDREEKLLEENDLLRERIRDNRTHISLLRRSNVMPESPAVATLNTPYITPAQTSFSMSRQTPSRQVVPNTPKQHGDQTFAALLLADRVLSQESPAATTRSGKLHSSNAVSTPPPPTTPAGRKGYGRSSVETPQRQSLLQSPPLALQTPTPRANQHRRRESRDSTISASDMEDQEAEMVVITQTPSSALRRSNIITTPTTVTRAAASAKSSTSASKARFSTAQNETLKRKLFADDDAAINNSPHALKRGRLSEGVGLGIGGLAEA